MRSSRAARGCVIALALLDATALSGQTAADPHGILPDGLVCTSCHTTEAWSPLRHDIGFDHGDTEFPLDGRHVDATCVRCHSDLVFDRIDTSPGDCAGCHIDVHEGSIARECASCHTTASFTELDFGVVHPADFPLEGAHLQTPCESCHVNDAGGAYRPLDTECASCHMTDYSSAALIDHERLGFSTRCDDCHSALDFRDVAFDHALASGGFALLGRHSGIECTACHSGPGGALPTAPTSAEDCYACHATDYDREHRGTGFPTDCLACHVPLDWNGASFDHTFPIFSGRHASEWNACSDCHLVPGDFTTFTCLTCHGQSETDSHHREERGYAYESGACLSCHPTGRTD